MNMKQPLRYLNWTSEHLISWNPPPEHRVKVDGSFFSINNSVACGGVFKNYLGRFIVGFSSNLDSCSIMQANYIWEILKSLQVAIAKNFNCLIIKTDSQMAMDFMKEGCPSSHPCKSLIEDISILSSRIQHVEWSHILREGKSIVDTLAKKGHSLFIGPILLILLS
ncbi:hypothetical protein AHAS_Ahas05G0100800 [Arachis hypogaea]